MIYAVIDTNVIVSALLTHNPLVATAKVLDFDEFSAENDYRLITIGMAILIIKVSDF